MSILSQQPQRAPRFWKGADGRSADDGFTLIELIIVVVVIAILSAVAVPLYSNFQDNARDTAVREDLRVFKNLRDAFNYQEGRRFTIDDIREINFRPALDAYETETVDHNLVYCGTGSPTDVYPWGIMALSKSGNAFYATDSTGVREYEGEWGTHQQYDLCDSIGDEFTVNNRGYAADDNGWREWAGG